SLANGIKFLKTRNGYIRPISVQIKITFGGTWPVGQRQVDVLKTIQSARPSLRGPGLVELFNRPVSLLQPCNESLTVGLRIRHESIPYLIVVAHGNDCRMVCISLRQPVGEDTDLTHIIGIADVIHI